MNVGGEKIPPAKKLLINNKIDNDDSYGSKASDLANASSSEGIKYTVV